MVEYASGLTVFCQSCSIAHLVEASPLRWCIHWCGNFEGLLKAETDFHTRVHEWAQFQPRP